MWVLDPVNSRELLDRLRPHAATGLEVLWCGEGWRRLVDDCHTELVTAFPNYRFHDIKQERGVLAFQAFPGPGATSTRDRRAVDAITEKYAAVSAATCEWCARPGTLRTDRRGWLTLCDRCHADLATTPYPTGPAPA